VVGVGEDDTEFENVAGIDRNTIETVGNVHFDQVHGSMTAISIDDGTQNALQGAAELHGLRGGQTHRGRIYTRPGVVDNGAGAAVALWDDANRADAQVG
jgi:hypothetical protein